MSNDETNMILYKMQEEDVKRLKIRFEVNLSNTIDQQYIVILEESFFRFYSLMIVKNRLNVSTSLIVGISLNIREINAQMNTRIRDLKFLKFSRFKDR